MGGKFEEWCGGALPCLRADAPQVRIRVLLASLQFGVSCHSVSSLHFSSLALLLEPPGLQLMRYRAACP